MELRTTKEGGDARVNEEGGKDAKKRRCEKEEVGVGSSFGREERVWLLLCGGGRRKHAIHKHDLTIGPCKKERMGRSGERMEKMKERRKDKSGKKGEEDD